MPTVQHPHFDDVTLEVADDELEAHLDAGWLRGKSQAPAKSANKDAWVAYAESLGDTGAAEKTKDQLIADHSDA